MLLRECGCNKTGLVKGETMLEISSGGKDLMRAKTTASINPLDKPEDYKAPSNTATCNYHSSPQKKGESLKIQDKIATDL